MTGNLVTIFLPALPGRRLCCHYRVHRLAEALDHGGEYPRALRLYGGATMQVVAAHTIDRAARRIDRQPRRAPPLILLDASSAPDRTASCGTMGDVVPTPLEEGPGREYCRHGAVAEALTRRFSRTAPIRVTFGSDRGPARAGCAAPPGLRRRRRHALDRSAACAKLLDPRRRRQSRRPETRTPPIGR